MDNLKSLFNKGNYKLIIDLTKDVESDFDALIYRINSLIKLENYKEALNTLNNLTIRNTLYNASPLKFMKLHLELLLHEEKYIEAIEIFKDYQNKPYISQEVEEFLNSVNNQVKLEMEKKKIISKMNSKEEIIKTLTTSNDEEKIISCIYNLKNLDINPYLTYLFNSLNNKEIKDDLKTLILLLLISKKINKNIMMYKNNKEYKLNPIKLIPPFTDEDYKLLIGLIYKYSKDPSVENVAKSLLSNYILNLYPDSIYTDKKENIAIAFVLLARDYLKINTDNFFFDNLKVDINFINKLKEKIKISLEKNNIKTK